MRSRGSILAGTILVIIGIALIVQKIYPDLGILAWWPVVFIIAGIYFIITEGSYIAGAIFSLIGIWILSNTAADQLEALFPFLRKVSLSELIFYLILVLIGIRLIFGRRFGKRNGLFYSSSPSNGFTANGRLPEYTAVLSGNRIQLAGKIFAGAKTTTVLGSIELDLRGSLPSPIMVLDVVTVFGGLEVFIPTGWNVVVSGNPIFGSVEDKRQPAAISADAPHLTINISTVMFGGVELK